MAQSQQIVNSIALKVAAVSLCYLCSKVPLESDNSLVMIPKIAIGTFVVYAFGDCLFSRSESLSDNITFDFITPNDSS